MRQVKEEAEPPGATTVAMLKQHRKDPLRARGFIRVAATGQTPSRLAERRKYVRAAVAMAAAVAVDPACRVSMARTLRHGALTKRAKAVLDQKAVRAAMA